MKICVNVNIILLIDKSYTYLYIITEMRKLLATLYMREVNLFNPRRPESSQVRSTILCCVILIG